MSKIMADVKMMRMPNFLKAKCLGQEITVDVGELEDEDAAAMWDHWKSFWRAHVKKRRDALKRGEPVSTPVSAAGDTP